MKKKKPGLKLVELGHPDGDAVSGEVMYTKLCRLIENGMESPRVWADLYAVCVRLGKTREARQALGQLRTTDEGIRLFEELEKRGLSRDHARPSPERSHPGNKGQYDPAGWPSSGAAEHRRPHPETDRHPLPQTSRHPLPEPDLFPPPRGGFPLRDDFHPLGSEPRVQRRRPSPPTRTRSSSGPQTYIGGRTPKESVGAEYADALQFLLRGSVPMKLVWIVLGFPVAIATGHFLAPEGFGEALTTAIRMLPVSLVFGICMHFCHRVLVEAADGEEEPPEVMPGVFGGSAKALVVCVLLVTLCIGPGVLALVLLQPLAIVACLAAAGLLYLPMAFLGISLRRSAEGGLPVRVLRAMAKNPGDYFQLCLAFAGSLLLPAVAVGLTLHLPLNMQVAIVGPLAIMPSIVIARTCGRYYYARRGQLRSILGLERVKSLPKRPRPGAQRHIHTPLRPR